MFRFFSTKKNANHLIQFTVNRVSKVYIHTVIGYKNIVLKI